MALVPCILCIPWFGSVTCGRRCSAVFNTETQRLRDTEAAGRRRKPRNTRNTQKGALRLCASVALCLCVNPSGRGKLVPCLRVSVLIPAAQGRCSAVFNTEPQRLRDTEAAGRRRSPRNTRNTRNTRKGALRLCASAFLCLCVNSAAQECLFRVFCVFRGSDP